MKKFLTLAALATLGYAAPASAADVIPSAEVPFAVTETEDWSNGGAGMKWQAVEIAGHSNKFMWTHNDGTTISTTVVNRPNREVYADSQLFAFIPDGDGYKIVNKAAGEGYYMTFNGSNVALMSESPENSVWKAYPTAVYANQNPENYACFKLVKGSSESDFINHQGGALKSWWQADQGSSNRFFAASAALIETYENAADAISEVPGAAEAYNAAKTNPYDAAAAAALSEVLKNATQTTVFNFKVNGTTYWSKTVSGYVGDSYNLIPPFFSKSATGNLRYGQDVVDIDGEMTVTLTTDLNNPVYYFINNVRKNKYAVTPGLTGQLQQKTMEELEATEGQYHLGSLWYFVAAGDVTPDGLLPVRMYNAYTEKAITNPASGAWGTADDSASLWYIVNNSNGGNTGVSIMHNTNKGDTNASWNDFQGGGTYVGYWAANDAGSIWTVEATDRDKVNATLAVIEELLAVEDVDAFNAVKTSGDAFVALGLASGDVLSAYNAISNTDAKKTAKVIAALTEAYRNMVAGASLSVNNVTLKFRNTKESRYMAPNANGNGNIISGNATETAGRTAFTLKHAADGNGFNLYNEYTNKYLKSGANASVQATLTDAASATVYTLKLLDVEGGRYGIAQIGKTDAAELLHTDGSNRVVNWRDGENTRWYLELVDEATAAKEHFEGGKVYYNGLLNSNSTAVGQYSITEDGKAAADAAIAAGDAEGATAEVVRASADALWSVETSLNMPVAGHFYRFICADNSSLQAMSALPLASDANRMQMADNNAANALATIFYLDEENHLVALSNGLCLGKFMQNDKGNSWKCVLGSNEKAANVTFQASAGQRGAYNIIASAGRYLHGSSDKVDCGGSDGAGYRWTIQEVNWLPIPGSNESYTTICMPVALNTEGKKLNVLTAEVENGRVVLTPFTLTNNVIPANTPLVLHTEMDGTQRDATNNLVYLMIDRNNEGTVPAQNALKGQTLAFEGTHKVLQGVEFAAAESVINGFSAYVEAEADVMAMTYAEIAALEGKAFTICSYDGRGYLGYKEGKTALWTSNVSGNTTADAANNVNFHWTFVSDSNGNSYLCNLGSKQLVGAYEVYGGAGTSEFGWHFGSYPTAVNAIYYDWIKNDSQNAVNILGGRNNASVSAAGMMIINNNNGQGQHPVPGVAGNSRKDGCGFIIAEVEGAVLPADLPGTAEVDAMLAAMAAEHAAAVAYIADEAREEVAETGVGHYNAEGFEAFSGKVAEADNSADAESKYYALVRGRIAAGDNVNKFEDGKVYNVFAADGQSAYKAVFVGRDNATGEHELDAVLDEAFDAEDIAYNWLAAVDADGNVTLSHSFTTASEEAVERSLVTPDENGLVTVNLADAAAAAYDGMGNVKLGEKNVVANLRVDNPETTAIREVNAKSENAASDVVYDLMGRRVNKASNGVYIINGKKMMVK